VRVSFPLALGGSTGNQVQYPDDIALFSDVDLDSEPGTVYATYIGKLSLTRYAPPAPPVNPLEGFADTDLIAELYRRQST